MSTQGTVTSEHGVGLFELAGMAKDLSPVVLGLHAAACAVLAPMGDSIMLADDGHAANIEQPKAFNDALLGFLPTA